jgi:hypothetical protein
MATDSILEKLRTLVRQPIDSEYHVVYLMVQARKLLERDGRNGGFQHLRFFANWVVHSTLDRSPLADDLVRRFNKVHEDREHIDFELARELDDWISFDALRRELNGFFLAYRVDPRHVTVVDHEWLQFVGHYAQVIKDIPLQIKGERLSHISEVTVTVVQVGPLDSPYRVYLEWSSQSRQTREVISHCKYL